MACTCGLVIGEGGIHIAVTYCIMYEYGDQMKSLFVMWMKTFFFTLEFACGGRGEGRRHVTNTRVPKLRSLSVSV